MGSFFSEVKLNEELPNSKEKGFSPIYRKKGVTQLRTTPDPSIKNLNDLINYTVTKYGDKSGVGYVDVTAQDDAEGKQFQIRNVKYYTYKEFYQIALYLGRSLAKHHLFSIEDIHKMKLIGIYSRNRFEWLVSDWACIMFGFTTVPLYDTLGIDNLSFCLNQTEITTTFATLATINILLQVKDHGKLKTIISYDEIDSETLSKLKQINIEVILYSDLIKQGRELTQIKSQTQADGNTCYTVSYTSGTTGPPKGALISHKNALSFVTGLHFEQDLHFTSDDVYISYLPLAHVMERTIFNSMCFEGATFVVASGNMLKLKEDCLAIKPTILLSVPRIFNRIVESTKAKFDAQTGIKKLLISCGINSKLQSAKEQGTYASSFYDSIIFQKVRDSFGGRVRILGSGSAPISAQTHMFMKAIMCCPLIQGYGQTESTAGFLFSRGTDKHYGVLASIAETCQVKICQIPDMKYTIDDFNQDGVMTPRGELWVRGSNVFLGYYKMQQLTKQTITEDGWLKTGDIVELNSQTLSFKIIDRKKNIFKLSQGEYVAPDKVQNIYLTCPLISEVYVHGQSTHHYAVAIATPKRQNLIKLAEIKHIEGNYEQLCKNEEIRRLVLIELNNIGKKAGLHGFQQAKNIYLDAEGFAPKNILTNTMKLIRFEARRACKDIFEELYKDGQLGLKE